MSSLYFPGAYTEGVSQNSLLRRPISIEKETMFTRRKIQISYDGGKSAGALVVETAACRLHQVKTFFHRRK